MLLFANLVLSFFVGASSTVDESALLNSGEVIYKKNATSCDNTSAPDLFNIQLNSQASGLCALAGDIPKPVVQEVEDMRLSQEESKNDYDDRITLVEVIHHQGELNPETFSGDMSQVLAKAFAVPAYAFTVVKWYSFSPKNSYKQNLNKYLSLGHGEGAKLADTSVGAFLDDTLATEEGYVLTLTIDQEVKPLHRLTVRYHFFLLPKKLVFVKSVSWGS